jgi:perosamine synthetase
MIPWWFTELGHSEKEALNHAFDHCAFTTNGYTANLEKNLAEKFKVPYAVVTNSGSSALTMSLLASGIGPGDKVIVPALTWIATAQAVDMVGAEPVLVDVKHDTPIIDIQMIEQHLDKNVKAIIPVHLNGRECDIEAIKDLCSDKDITIIEDTCKGMLSRSEQNYLGTLADIGCFSMGMISLISVGYGGFLLTHSQQTYQKLLSIRDHGVIRSPEEYRYRGANFKISDLLSSIGLAQLREIEQHKKAVLDVYKCYREGLKNFAYGQVQPIDTKNGKVPIYTEMYSPYRDDIERYLKSKNIQISCYHQPLNTAGYLNQQGHFPHAENLCRHSFVLPSGPSQSQENILSVIDALNAWRPQ